MVKAMKSLLSFFEDLKEIEQHSQTLGAPTLTEKSKQTSKHLFHEVLCRRDPVILSLSGKFLDSA